MSRLSPKAQLNQLGLLSKKKYGQCFLHDPMVISRIVDAIPNDNLKVVEVGPGLGALTFPLLTLGHQIVAIDRDSDMIAAIEDMLDDATPSRTNMLETICADILTVDLTALAGDSNRIHVVGNLPYNISSQIIFQILASHQAIQTATIMIQKELADRIMAKPGTKQYGIPTVLCAQYANINVVVQVSRGAFYPPPRVDSTVLQLDFGRGTQYKVGDAQLAQVVKAAFAARRKTIKRSLSLKYCIDDVSGALESACIDPSIRAEALPLEAFVRLAKALEIVSLS